MLVVVILLVGRALILWLSAVVGSTWLMGARVDVGYAALFVEGGGVVVPEEGWTTAGRVRGVDKARGRTLARKGWMQAGHIVFPGMIGSQRLWSRVSQAILHRQKAHARPEVLHCAKT
jgi:hypothetical protein